MQQVKQKTDFSKKMPEAAVYNREINKRKNIKTLMILPLISLKYLFLTDINGISVKALIRSNYNNR